MSRKPIDLTALPNEPVEIRLYHAKESCDGDVLRALSSDSFWFVRDYVAANIHTPEECLLQLLEDPDFRIRKEAERTLHKQALAKETEPSQWQQAMEKLSLNERLMAAAARAAGQPFPIVPDKQPER